MSEPSQNLRLYKVEQIEAIADAIRETAGILDKFTVSEMPDAIRQYLKPGGLKMMEFELTISECTIS